MTRTLEAFETAQIFAVEERPFKAALGHKQIGALAPVVEERPFKAALGHK
jgi:hypothetical protein